AVRTVAYRSLHPQQHTLTAHRTESWPGLIRALTDREPATRATMKKVFGDLGYEVIPFKKTEQAVLDAVPTDVRLTVTASPAKGQDATVDLAVALAGHGYSVAPHLSAQQVRDRAHLAAVVARCREAGVTDAFVTGGGP